MGQANYSAAKAGIAAMTLVAAAEMGRYGVTVNAIAPSARTRMTETVFAEMMSTQDSEFDAMAPEMKEAYDFTLALRGLVPGPHKIWLANPTLSKTIVPTGAYFQRESTLRKPEIEIATNIVNARWRSPPARRSCTLRPRQSKRCCGCAGS